MKRTGIAITLLAAATTAMWSQEGAKKTEAAKPIALLAWLVGGVWTADASKLGPGVQRIETRYQWADNDAYIRFNTHFVLDKGTIRRYDGNFFWNPEQASLAMWYMDPANSITQGPVTMEGDVMQMTFRGENFEGKTADMRVRVTRVTNDHYGWRLEEKQPDGWKQLLALEYIRGA